MTDEVYQSYYYFLYWNLKLESFDLENVWTTYRRYKDELPGTWRLSNTTTPGSFWLKCGVFSG